MLRRSRLHLEIALKATERQFVALLGATAGNLDVRLSFYALPEVPRTDWGRRYVENAYASIDALWSSRLDGLIVTGRRIEPRPPVITITKASKV